LGNQLNPRRLGVFEILPLGVEFKSGIVSAVGSVDVAIAKLDMWVEAVALQLEVILRLAIDLRKPKRNTVVSGVGDSS
jgi:hypothetical protein